MPVVALATLYLHDSTVNSNPVGYVAFSQLDDLSPSFAMITADVSNVANSASTWGFRLEIHPNPTIGAAGSATRCSGVGDPAYNPFLVRTT